MTKEKHFIAMLFLLLLSEHLITQSIYETYSGFTVPEVIVLPSSEVHPSLWFRESDLEYIRNLRNKDTYANNVWKRISSTINNYKSKSVALTGPGERSIMAKVLAFAWIIDGDTLAKRKAIEALMMAYDNVPRTSNPLDFEGEYDEIYRASWLQNFCAAYDWIQPQLTSEQDSVIRRKLIEEVILLKDNMVSGARYAPRPHNHRFKPACAIGTAALTFSSDPRAEGWLRFAIQQMNTVTKYMFSFDGIYREGPHYFLYSAVNFIPFLWHYKNVSGVDFFTYYKPAFEWCVNIRNSRGWMPNIEDSYIKPFPTHMVAKAYMSERTNLHSTKPLGEILQWNWFNTNLFTTKYTGATSDLIWDIYEYLTYDPSIPQAQPDCNPTLLLESGQVVFRNTWSPNDFSARYLLFHGVAEADNHNHPDHLSYVVEANLSLTAIDAGYGKEGFSDPKRSWYTSSEAHNVVTINGLAPIDWGPNIGPRDLHFVTLPDFDFAEKMAKTIAPGGLIRRGIAFPDKKYWIVYDVAYSNTKVDYKLFVHSRGTLSRKSDNEFLWITPTDIYGFSSKLYVPIFPDTLNFSIKSAWLSIFKDEETQSYIEAYAQSDTFISVHLLIPLSINDSFPEIRKLVQNGEILAFKILQGNQSETICVQKNNSKIGYLPEFFTNALFMWTKIYNGELVKFFFNEGNNFGYMGYEIITASVPLTIFGDFTDKKRYKLYIDTVKNACDFYFTSPDDSIIAVRMDGVFIPFETLCCKTIKLTLSKGWKGTLEMISDPSLINNVIDNKNSEGGEISINIYPNPFNNLAVMEFYLSESKHVKVEIYNLIGQLVKTVVNDELAAGRHRYVIKGEDLPSGIYFYRFYSEGFRQTGKVILLK
jgi:hypothetical protein